MKRYVVIFEDSAQADVRKLDDWAVVLGASAKPSNGPANCGLRLSNH